MNSFVSFVRLEEEVKVNTYSPSINNKVKEFIKLQFLTNEYFVHLLEKYDTFISEKLSVSKRNEYHTYQA
jgi:hypothetical protein